MRSIATAAATRNGISRQTVNYISRALMQAITRLYAALQRFVGKRMGYAQLGFENVNRAPTFIYDPRSDFYLLKANSDFKKENTTHLFASLWQPALRLKLSGHYYLLTNYAYLSDYYHLQPGRYFVQRFANCLAKNHKAW